MLYVFIGQLGDVNESVLMNADINECAEIDNVSDSSREHHIGLEVLDAHNVVAKRRRSEAVSDVSSGLLKLGYDVVKRGRANAAFRADLAAIGADPAVVGSRLLGTTVGTEIAGDITLAAGAVPAGSFLRLLAAALGAELTGCGSTAAALPAVCRRSLRLLRPQQPRERW